MQSIF